MEDYDSLEFDSAQQDAASRGGEAARGGPGRDADGGQDLHQPRHRLLRRLQGSQPRRAAVRQRAQDRSATQLDPERATPELEDAFQTARKQVGVKAPSHPEAPPTPPPTSENPTPPTLPNENPPTPPASAVKGLQHNPVDESRPDSPIPSPRPARRRRRRHPPVPVLPLRRAGRLRVGADEAHEQRLVGGRDPRR